MDANRHENDSCSRRIVKGLTNVGNSCYFNSVMQNLLAVGELRENFMRPTEFPEGPITSALRELYVKTSSDGSEHGDNIQINFTWLYKGIKTVNPRNLFNAVCAKLPQFRGFEQQDSHELLRCLLDKLNTEELASLRNSNPANCGDGEATECNTYESSNQRNNETLVDCVFHGQLCSTICCSKCGCHSVTYEPFHDLSLPIPSKPESMKASLNRKCSSSFNPFFVLGDDNPSSDDDKDDEESSAVQEKKDDVCETENLLYGENNGDNLFKSKPVNTEAREEERKAAVIPMSVDGCLVEFTRPEILSGENGWKCPNCAAKLVSGSDNLQNTEDGIQVEKSNLLKTEKDTELEISTLARCLKTSDTKTDDYQLHSGSVTGSGGGLNGNTSQQAEVPCNSKDIDNCQPSSQEGHQNRRGFEGHDIVPIHYSSAEGVSCSDAEGHSNKTILRIFGDEDRLETDGINQAERPTSTSSEEGDKISANLREWDLESKNIASSGGGHRLKKISKIREDEVDSNNILQEATKRYLISKAPRILTIHLKRFKHGLFGRLSKLDGHVSFEERLDLRPYMDSRSPDKDNCFYRLIGVVNHGGGMTFGHYVAHVRGDQDGSIFQWFCASDSRVEEVSLREVLASEAYILFYEKCC